jgi:HSP20 family protein
MEGAIMKGMRALAPAGLGVRDPFAFLRRMTSELDRVFEEPRWLGPAFEPRAWVPSLEVVEKGNHLIARVELPGLKKEEVTVEVKEGFVQITGERKQEKEVKKEHVYRCEREYGTFFRSFALPEGVAAEDVKASMTDGVLEVSMPLPRPVEARTRKVEIAGATEPAAHAAA